MILCSFDDLLNIRLSFTVCYTIVQLSWVGKHKLCIDVDEYIVYLKV